METHDKTEEVKHRFKYHPPTTAAKQTAHEKVRATFLWAALEMNSLLPEGREKALALTKLEEGMFWSNAAIARDNKSE